MDQAPDTGIVADGTLHSHCQKQELLKVQNGNKHDSKIQLDLVWVTTCVCCWLEKGISFVAVH